MTKERLLLTFLLIWQCTEGKTLLENIRSNPNFSEITKLIEKSRSLQVFLEERGSTAFIPTNEAMEKYTGEKTDKLVFYHLANIAYMIQNVPSDLTTELTGNPRIFVTRIPSGHPSINGWENFDFYINNAKVISANHRSETARGEIQYLHTVDEVIAPTLTITPPPPGPDAQAYYYPDARRVLEKSSIYGLTDPYNLKELYSSVKELNMLDIFETPGKNTFFMPVNDALKPVLNANKNLIDKQLVRGHIVPNKVLFTRTVRYANGPFNSLAFADNLQVVISITNTTNRDSNKVTYYVNSNTLVAGNGHKKGGAYARIIKSNIPVKNGVMHLIDRPLMLIAPNIMSYFREEDGQLSRFQNLMNDHYIDMTNLLVNKENITLFAPSNKAFDNLNIDHLNKAISNSEQLKKILLMHVVTRRLTTDEITERIGTKGVQTMADDRLLYFSVNDPNAVVPIVSLEGNGVNATITTPNIATNNGIIHIIDRLLGIPSQSVYDKLASDPTLSYAFALSEQRGWNKQLADRTKKFTLFVPNNEAWNYIKREMVSAYKTLFSGSFPAHAERILQRHTIVNSYLTLEQLVILTQNSTLARDNVRSTELQMIRQKIYFQAKLTQSFGGANEATKREYFLDWEGITSRVVRPDVQCVNGVIHVIDRVLMNKDDVTVAGSVLDTPMILVTLFSTVISIISNWCRA